MSRSRPRLVSASVFRRVIGPASPRPAYRGAALSPARDLLLRFLGLRGHRFTDLLKNPPLSGGGGFGARAIDKSRVLRLTATTMVTLRTLPDKDLAAVLRHDAGRYIVASETLADRTDLDLAHPCYFLRCHAIELLLKAVLLATGSSLKEAENYLHDLSRAFKSASDRGLTVAEETAKTIAALSGLHSRHQFKYRKSSRFDVPIAIAYPNDEVSRRSLRDLFERCGALLKEERSKK